jgi:hypothetical protein
MSGTIGGATAASGKSSADSQKVGGATADQIAAETAAAQQVNQAMHESNLAQMQMNATKAMGEMMKNAV